MCDAKIEEITIPIVDQPGLGKTAYKVTVREFKVGGARKIYNYYTDKDLAYYIANQINKKEVLEDS